jgi:hypothetical protein
MELYQMRKSYLIFVLLIALTFSCTNVYENPLNEPLPPSPNPGPEPEPDPYDIRPKPPSNIWIVEKNNEMIKIAWEPVDNAILYNIYSYRNYADKTLIDYTDETNYTFSQLQSNESYVYLVCSYNNGGESYFGIDISCETDEAYGIIRVWAIWPPVPDYTYKDSFYIDNRYIGAIPAASHNDYTVLTGCRELKLVGNGEGAGREVGITIYLTTDGYNWNNRYEYDWRNY